MLTIVEGGYYVDGHGNICGPMVPHVDTLSINSAYKGFYKWKCFDEAIGCWWHYNEHGKWLISPNKRELVSVHSEPSTEVWTGEWEDAE